MSTAIAKVGGAQLARAEDGLTQEQVELVKRTIAKGATNDELALFVSTANRLRLDPFARQIFLVKRYDSQVGGLVATPQVSVDGFRLVAERTKQYRGQTAPQWCGRDGKWTDVWLQDEPPAAARVGVYREGFAEPLVRVALYKSYAQTKKDGSPNAMWAKYPEVMLAKCAESLALRSAFPNELSGVYTEDEMPAPAPEPVQSAPRATPQERLDAIAAGGQRAESRPTEASTTESRPTSPADGTQTTDGELADLKSWGDRYIAECTDASRGDEKLQWPEADEFGIPPPPFPVPKLRAGRYSGKQYDDVPEGLLRAMANKDDFGTRVVAERLWALYLIFRHEAEKAKEQSK